jgi:hypothetical protein
MHTIGKTIFRQEKSMEKMNTRLSPTTNGPLSVAHLYVSLVNEHEAHISGGLFGVRHDDTQRWWNWKSPPAQIEAWKNLMREDLEWMGIKVDWWMSDSDMHDEIMELAAHVGTKPPLEPFCYDQLPEDIGQDGEPQYPYAPYYTWFKVLADMYGATGTGAEVTNLLIRGADIKSEFSLYCYFTETFGFPRVRHVYLPRLNMVSSGQNGLEAVSKTNGKLKVCDMRRRGVTPLMIEEALRESCLKDECGCWSIDNIKKNPVWNGYEWDHA